MITDPIADMLTRIRNANQMKHATVSMPASKVKAEILRVLKAEGYISDYVVKEEENKNEQSLCEIARFYVVFDQRLVRKFSNCLLRESSILFERSKRTSW